MLEFRQADLGASAHRDILLRFNIDYLNWIADNVQAHFGLSVTDLLEASVEEYVAAALDKLCASAPPEGVFYIIFDGPRAVGMGGIRRVRDGVGELKRIYVAPDVRGGGVGAKSLERLLQDIQSFGYREAVLESGPFMQSAHHLYEAVGFADCDPYPEAEVPAPLHQGWRFMRRNLS
jgi:GNAT superfamily N-acetyltransferase